MTSIRFKDYQQDKASFDRLFKQTAQTPSQSLPFEPIAEALMDANRYFVNLQAQANGKQEADEKFKLQRKVEEFKEEFVTVKSYKAVSCKSLGWLKLATEDYVVLKKHKVIG